MPLFMVFYHIPYYFLDVFVGGFYGSIHLRSVGGGILVLNFESFTNSFHQITIEVGGIGSNNGLRNSELVDNTILDKICNDFLGYSFVRCSFYPFCEVINGYQNKPISV